MARGSRRRLLAALGFGVALAGLTASAPAARAAETAAVAAGAGPAENGRGAEDGRRTVLIKVAVGRERPNGQDNQSFPSGHTSNAFTLAAVAERHYGWKIGVPAYLLAGVVGASRLEQDKHWLSDLVAGATLGYIVGRSVVRVNSRPLEAGRRGSTEINLAPIVARRGRGVQLSLVF